MAATAPGKEASQVHASPHSRFKSQHLNTIRSMHMIQELQSYIENLENLAQQQRDELHRVTEINKGYEKRTRHTSPRSKLGEEFGNESSDLPPRLRAIIEDNRVLKDRARKYKDEVSKNKRKVVSQEQEILKYKDKLRALGEKLKTLDQTEGDVMSQKQLKEKVGEQESFISDLETKVSIITKSKEVENRKFRNNLTIANRKLKEHEGNIAELQAEIQAKEKDLRASKLECRAVQRKLEEAQRAAHTMKRRSTPSTSERGQGDSGKPLQLVLNIVESGSDHHGSSRLSRPKAAPADDDASAALAIQSRYRGFKARRDVKQKKSENKAALKIQSAHRGRTARRQSLQLKQKIVEEEEQKQKEEKAAVQIQSRARGMMAKKKVSDLKTKKEEEAVDEAEDGAGKEVVTNINKGSPSTRAK